MFIIDTWVKKFNRIIKIMYITFTGQHNKILSKSPPTCLKDGILIPFSSDMQLVEA